MARLTPMYFPAVSASCHPTCRRLAAFRGSLGLVALSLLLFLGLGVNNALRAEERLPWGETRQPELITPRDEPIELRRPYARPTESAPPSSYEGTYETGQPQDIYRSPRQVGGRPPYAPPESTPMPGRPYAPPDPRLAEEAERRSRIAPPRNMPRQDSYSSQEITMAGHRFLGKATTGLAKVIEHAFAKYGRPNGYILGEEAGGALVAGLVYGEGMLFTKNAGIHKVYWQGPSIGYDFGANGAKVMILVYNLRSIGDIYDRFTGISGAAYFVGGASITYQKKGDVVLAPIRVGLGLRLGANVGYLKYTRRPTWNPF